VLKLVYHTAVFGPINLEYEKPLLRVGSGEDNDLVVPHPSVKRHHCLLSFWEENVALLPPDVVLSTPTEIPAGCGEVLGLGDTLRIGAVEFTLEHSINTVALPETAHLPPAEAPAAPGPAGPRYYCAHCGIFLAAAQVKRVGLVGHAKHFLCPNCSAHVQPECVPVESPSGFLAMLRKLWRRFKAVLLRPPARRL